MIQHLDPKHDSHLTELLSKTSKMPVSEVKGETRAEPNRVYVIPPRCNLDIAEGPIHTPPRPGTGHNMPVDVFLRAFASDQGSKAIGVILSGTASDGTLGLQAIQAAAASPSPRRSRRRSMTACHEAPSPPVWRVLCCRRRIARQLAAIARGSQIRVGPREAIEPPEDSELTGILRLVRSATGVDFTYYKHSTLARRIKRRMHLRGFENLKEYGREIERNREEAAALCESCLITVTAFFREPEVFAELKEKVLPSLVENRGPEDPIRIRAAGCATGEEAYSIAICLVEFLEDAKLSIPFEIFATDISETAIDHARAGIYKDSALFNVSPQRLARFFTRTERGCQIAKSIRDVCVFARHNVAQDPPFSKLDLVSCCNVLIYLGAVLQRKVLSILQYALKPEGFLVLGPSENTGALSESFHQVDKAHKIYCMRPAASTPAPGPREGRRAEARGSLRGKTAGPGGAGRAKRSRPASASRILPARRHR